MNTQPTASTPSPGELYWDDDDVRALEFAAQQGDMEAIQTVEDRFGGAIYSFSVAQQAIESGHLAFFERYIMLCRCQLILVMSNPQDYDEYSGQDNIWDYYLQPFQECLYAQVDEEIRHKAARIVFETFVPNLAEQEEVAGNRLRKMFDEKPLPVHNDTVWSFDDFHTAVNADPGLGPMWFFTSGFHEKIFRYLADEIGLRFEQITLKIWSTRFNPRIYQFVLDHLDDGIDRNNLPDDCHYIRESPNDADFFDFLRRCVENSENQHSHANLLMMEFLEHHPQFIPKIASLIRQLQFLPGNVSRMWPRLYALPSSSLRDPNKIEEILRFIVQFQSQLPNIGEEQPFDIYCRKHGLDFDQDSDSGNDSIDGTEEDDQSGHDYMDLYTADISWMDLGNDEDDCEDEEEDYGGICCPCCDC